MFLFIYFPISIKFSPIEFCLIILINVTYNPCVTCLICNIWLSPSHFLSSLGFQHITLSGISSDLFCSKSLVSVLSSSSSPRPHKFSVPRHSDLEPLLYHAHFFVNFIQSLSIRYYLYTNNALLSLWSPVCFHELQTHILARGILPTVPSFWASQGDLLWLMEHGGKQQCASSRPRLSEKSTLLPSKNMLQPSC